MQSVFGNNGTEQLFVHSLRSRRDYCAEGTFLATQPPRKCSRGFADKNYSTRPLIRSTNG